MRIRTLSLAGAVVSVFVTVAAVVGLYLTDRNIEKVLRKDEVSRAIMQKVFERTTITGDYLLHPERRTQIQWKWSHESLERLLDDLVFKGTETSQTLVEMRENHRDASEVFRQLTKLHATRGAVETPNKVSRALEQRLVARLLTTSQTTVSAASRLAREADRELKKSLRRQTWLIIILGVSLTVVLGGSWFLVSRRVVRPIRELQRGIQILGGGDLDYRIGAVQRDEFGEVATAFNLMAGQLKLTTVSRDELIDQIRERERAEEEIGERERDLAEAQRLAHLGSWEWDSEINDVQWSEELYRIYGIEPAEFAGTYEAFLGRVHPDDRAGIRKAVDDALQRKKPYSIDHRIILPNGEQHHINSRGAPTLDEDGNVIGLRGTALDITERKRAEAELRESEERLRSIASNVPSAIFRRVHRPDGTMRFTFVSDAYTELYGRNPEEIIEDASVLQELVHPDDRDRFFATVERAVAKLEQQDVDYRIVMPTGQTKWVHSIAKPVRIENGDIIVDGVAVDITERKAAEERARQHEAELAHVLRVSTMGEMATALAHEINQPLAAVVNFCRGSVRRIKSGKWDAAELVKALDEAGTEAERAGQIVHGIRSFVRKSERKTSPEDINAMVRAAMNLAESEVRENNVKVRVDLADGLPLAVVDATEIEQVVLNLLMNGIEAMMESRARDRKLTIRTSMGSDGSVEVAVSDRGPGLPAELGSTVFEPFVSTKPGGMGMGLSISRTIVERHGGTISASDNANGGATFRFTLPAASEASGDDS